MSLSNDLVLPQLVHARGVSNLGARPFLTEVGGRSLSYADTDLTARRWAAALRERGIGAGDRVAVMVPTSIEAMLTWLACGWLRAYEVPVHAEYRGAMLRHLLANSGAAILIIHRRFLPALATLDLDGLALETVIVVAGDAGEDWRAELPERFRATALPSDQLIAEPRPATDGPGYWDVGSIVYTSGTTGLAKGVLVAWRQFYKHGEIAFPLDEGGPDDVYYCPLPLSHISGRIAIYNMALCGGGAVLREKFSINAFWDDVKAHGCTCTLLMGSIAEMLWRQPASAGDADTTLTKVFMGPLIPQVEGFKQRFGVRVRTQFGMSETAAPLVSGITSPWDLANAASCGRPAPGFHCRIADENDEPLGPGEVGELLIRSDEPWLIFRGYWQDEAATNAAFRNQWFHTGDGFRYDEDGNYYFVDRMKDTIRRRGENVSSFFVEQTMAEYPALADCAVVGVDSTFTEQEIHAFLVCKPDASVVVADVRAFLADRLPPFMIPRFWSFIDELPRTTTQRVRKVELRARAMQEHEAGRAIEL